MNWFELIANSTNSEKLLFIYLFGIALHLLGHMYSLGEADKQDLRELPAFAVGFIFVVAACVWPLVFVMYIVRAFKSDD